jgi:hypothetical protein
VIGLGAPISVQIRLSARQLPGLRTEVQRLLDEARERALEAAAPDVVAWEAMLEALVDSDPGGEIEVLWPTVLALPALQGAAYDALDAVDVPSRGQGELDAAAEQLHLACEAVETLRSVLAVDRGGLQDVDL